MNPLIDINILIYSAKPEFSYLRSLILSGENFVSALSLVEVLGYYKLTEEDRNYFDASFHLLTALPISDEVISKATELRKMYRMKTADAIIAATAVIHQLELITRNIGDFESIPLLNVSNPIK